MKFDAFIEAAKQVLLPDGALAIVDITEITAAHKKILSKGLDCVRLTEVQGPPVIVMPPNLWAALNDRLQQTGYGRLVALGDGGYKLELTEAGKAADDAEARKIRRIILYLQGAGIYVNDALPASMQQVRSPTNAERMQALRAGLGKKGRW